MAQFESRIPSVVEGLRSPELDKRTEALERLREISEAGLQEAEAIQALKAATGNFPPLEYEWLSASGELVRAASSIASIEMIPVVRQKFPRYGASARAEALKLLSSIPSQRGARAYLDLLLLEIEHPVGTKELPIDGFERHPRYGEILFPDLLLALNNENFRWNVARLTLLYFDSGRLEAGQLDESYGLLEDQIRPLLSAVKAQAPDDKGNWLWEEDYAQARWMLALFLDLAGFFETVGSTRLLEETVELPDPRLKFFAAKSLLLQGEQVPKGTFRSIAESAEMRKWLFKYLKERGELSLIPRQYYTQEALAESDMVNWLLYPTELDRTPSEIELVKTVRREVDSDPVRFYVFKFRTEPPHWAAEDGWMLGVSGPFLEKEIPSAFAGGGTFSTFARLDETDPDTFLAEVSGLIEDFHEQKDITPP